MFSLRSLAIATLIAGLPLVAWADESGATIKPFGQSGNFRLVKNWTFGNGRPDATITNKSELDENFYYRYIYDSGRLDKLPTYWSYHRDYPEGDPRSLHVFGANDLTLKGRVPAGGGLRQRGIESGILRAKLAVVPGMYIEMRARLPRGIGVWPAFWLNPGVQESAHSFSALPWPPEIDIFEFFNWQGRPKTTFMTSNIQTNGVPAKYGMPHDIFTKFKNGEYAPGPDFSEDFHVFALDWVEDEPVWLLDGVPIKKTYYEWHAPPAHILVGNQLGIAFADMSKMTANEDDWNYVIDYIRVWERVRE